jgi:hypothetical protein
MVQSHPESLMPGQRMGSTVILLLYWSVTVAAQEKSG